jgi:hypothetical protein
MICDLHVGLEDDSAWELVGFFGDTTMLAQRRYVLDENGITSLVVDHEEEAVELYVPNEEKDDAYAALAVSAEDEHSCPGCKIFYTGDMETCPVCGAKPSDDSRATDIHD